MEFAGAGEEGEFSWKSRRARWSGRVVCHLSFVIRHSLFVIRHSSFVTRHSSLVSRLTSPHASRLIIRANHTVHDGKARQGKAFLVLILRNLLTTNPMELVSTV